VSIRYFHLVDNETFSNRKQIVDAIIEAENEGSAWCVMADRKIVMVSHDYAVTKRYLDDIWNSHYVANF